MHNFHLNGKETIKDFLCPGWVVDEKEAAAKKSEELGKNIKNTHMSWETKANTIHFRVFPKLNLHNPILSPQNLPHSVKKPSIPIV